MAATLAWMLAWIAGAPQAPAGEAVPGDRPAAGGLTWIENRGQWDVPARFVARTAGGLVRAEPAAIALQVGGASGGTLVRLVFEGASEAGWVEGLDPRPGLHSWIVGNDPGRWVCAVPSYRRVVQRALYEGVDLVLRDEAGELEYDLVLAPGADLEQVRVRCEGALAVCAGDDGALRIETVAGPVEQSLARAWQVLANGSLEDLELSCRLLDGTSFGFAVRGRDPGLALVVDPGLVWSTYLGGSSSGDFVLAADVDSGGDVTVTGFGGSAGFFITPGAYSQPSFSGTNVIVSRFRKDTGELLYSTLIAGTGLGGNPLNQGHDVAVDAQGRATVVGFTSAVDFPTTPDAFAPVKIQPQTLSGFALRLDPTGTSLDFSTFLEGFQGSQAFAVDLAPDGSAVVGGSAFSTDFPTTRGAFQTDGGPFLQASRGFVTRLSHDGSALTWSTFLGGKTQAVDTLLALRCDEQGRVTVAGQTFSNDFPTTPGAYSTQPPSFPCSGLQAFVSRLSSDGSSLEWSTYLGGCAEDKAQALALLPDGGVIVTGNTKSLNFPTTPGAFQSQLQGSQTSVNDDGFVTRFDPSGSSLVYSTYLGSTGPDIPGGVMVDASGVATLTGRTEGEFPTTPGSFLYQHPLHAGDVFITRMDPQGKRLFYSTYLGGPSLDGAGSIAAMPGGHVVVGGATAGGFPTTPGSFSPNFIGGQFDAFVTVLDPLPTGVQRFGTSTPACQGEILLGVTEVPRAGAENFALWSSGAPPAAAGWLLVGAQPLAVPLHTRGVDLWLAPTSLLHVAPLQADANGYAEARFPLAQVSSGTSLHFQMLFRNDPACGGAGTLSASDALSVAVN